VNLTTHDRDTYTMTDTAMLADGKMGPAFERRKDDNSGPAFDGLRNRPLATELARSLQSQGLAAAGDVLDALSRKCIEDVMATWTRLIAVLRLDFTPIPLHVGQWGAHPWDRLSASVVQAMCHADLPSATIKWVSADAAIRAWVRGFRDGAAQELYRETHLTDRDLSEDGAAVPERVAYLQSRIETMTRFMAGVR
jgi:hypothetical protein